MTLRRTVLAAEALGFMLLARLGLWVLAGAVGPGIVRLPALGRVPRNMRGSVKEVRWAVLAAVRHAPVELVCFPQCLAALTMLRRRGVGSRLHYGVTRLEGRLATHTWLEADGQDVIGGEVARNYRLLATYEATAPKLRVRPGR